MKDNIIKVDYTEEMEQSYIDYAMSVIVQRAIPDLRDGLKPVHRRILYAMSQLDLAHNKPYKKSARITGDVLGKYHPHSDSSVYEAMVRLAQEFNINHPLVRGQGNFGSIDGDRAAAMRYTEAKLEEISNYLLEGLDKETINFLPNFDNTMEEPEVLPARFFNLLVNGSTGIAVGMSTNIPPHNLNEIVNATKAYLKDEEITSRGLLRYIKGPDFPTGGVITNKDQIKNIYETGNGRIKVRAVFDVEDLTEGRKNLIITEIPWTFAGNKTRLLENIISLIEDGKLDEVVDIGDESNKDGLRIVLEVKRGVNIENFKRKLYSISKLEDTVPVNMLSIVRGRPEILSIKDMMTEYVSFLKEIHIKEITYDLEKLENSKEIKDGFLLASDNIDLIISLIRGSQVRKDVLNALVNGDLTGIKLKSKELEKKTKSLKFTQKQAEAVLRMQLQSLVGLEVNKLEEELKEIKNKIKDLKKLLDSPDNLNDFIVEELDEIKKKYGKNRKTKIEQVSDEEFVEKVKVEDLYALIDEFNYLKVIDNQSYVRTNPETLNEFKFVIKIKSNDNLCIFDDNANFNQFKMEDLPISRMADRGKPLPNDIKLLYANSLENLKNNEVLFVTKNSYVKRVDAEEYITNRRQIIGTKVEDDDKLIGVHLVTPEIKELVLITNDKRKLRFNVEEVSNFKRNAIGVIGMNLNQGDFVISSSVHKKTDKDKRTRGAKGAILD